MSHRANQEWPPSYMDGLKVKISEKYKPPPKIGLAVSYSQRLTLNKHIQDTLPAHDFALEKSVKAKMQEWRNARKTIGEQLEARLGEAREEEGKRRENRRHLEEVEETEAALFVPSHSYSRILTPIPLTSQDSSCKPIDKSPFNLSDFEADTSSPFDNMELKSINEMEELAQVLKRDSNFTTNPQSFSYNCIPLNYMQPTTSSFQSTNGYYYPQQAHLTSPKASMSLGRSVPDIIKDLQTDLDKTHLKNAKLPLVANKNNKSDDLKAKEDDLNNDEFCSLPRNLQELSKSISSMGFPLSRVARTCKLLGNDEKKVVDHLLAMSDLLGLGFPEAKVSEALLQCNNDRDKALDVLIS